MKELLSNEEIDTLLDLFRAEGAELDATQVHDLRRVAAESDRAEALVSPIDLLKPNRLTRDHLSGFERYFGNAAKSMTAAISDRLRFEVSCDCVAVEQLRFGTWNGQLHGPVAIYVLDMPPFDLPVLLTMTSGMLYGAVDRILGGTGKVEHVPSDFTAAEYIVADALIGPCLDCVCDALRDLVEVRWAIKKRFCNPAMAQIIAQHEVIVSVYFQVSGEHLMGDIRLAIPFTLLEPLLDRVDSGIGSGFNMKPGGMRDEVGKSVGRVPLHMTVVLGESAIPLRTLLSIQQGDVISLRTKIGEDLVAPVQGVPKFRGQVGTQGNRLAFRVGSVVES